MHMSPNAAMLARKSSSSLFNRDLWLQRNEFRRKEEWKSLHAEKLTRASPVLRYKLQTGRLATPDYMQAVNACKSGGSVYNSWSQKNLPRRNTSIKSCELLRSF